MNCIPDSHNVLPGVASEHTPDTYPVRHKIGLKLRRCMPCTIGGWLFQYAESVNVFGGRTILENAAYYSRSGIYSSLMEKE